MNNLIIYVAISSIITCFALFLSFIPVLKTFKAQQYERSLGPKTHKRKEGTPTMGGLMILITILFIFTILIKVLGKTDYPIDFSTYILLIIPLIGYGLLGFVDDYLIIRYRNNEGVSVISKLVVQTLIAGIFFLIYMNYFKDTTIDLYFVKLDLKGFYGVLIFLMLVGGSNAVNITDGLDGLAGGLLMMSFLAFMVIALQVGNFTVFFFSLIVFTSLLPFMFFNIYPAKIFMGNVGSLALGGSLSVIAILLKREVLLLIVAFVFVIEALSVIIQVFYFKASKGKRILKMAPLHHHFELCGMKEYYVTLMFWMIGLFTMFISIYLGGL